MVAVDRRLRVSGGASVVCSNPHRYFAEIMTHTVRWPVRRAGAWALLALVGCSSGDSGPGAPASLEVVAGAGQAADVGTLLPVPPSVRVRDAESRPVPGVTIRYSVVSGGGTITGDSARTNANGVAPLGS